MKKRSEKQEVIKAFDITLLIRKRISVINDELEKRKRSLNKAPEGYLKCRNDGFGFRYSQRMDSKELNGRYLKKNEYNLTVSLAQKEYDNKFVSCAEQELTCLENFLEKYEKCDIDSIYDRMHEGKRILVNPFRLKDDEYIKKWKEVEYSTGYFPEGYEEYYTFGGLRVHSKSEIIIADTLDNYGIPYRYEYPIRLDGIEKRPDFTCLNVRTRCEYIWEHFGMMGVEDYSNANIAKINRYILNGYIPGENAIFTFENSTNPLDTRIVKAMIERYLM